MGVNDRLERFREGFAPWAGLAAGTVGGAFAHQVGSEGVFDECNSSPALVLTVAVIAFLIICAGAFESWSVLRTDAEGPARRFIAAVSLGTVALVVFAILLPAIAALLIPACFA